MPHVQRSTSYYVYESPTVDAQISGRDVRFCYETPQETTGAEHFYGQDETLHPLPQLANLGPVP